MTATVHDITPGLAFRRGAKQLVGKVCIARTPVQGEPGRTQLCLDRLQDDPAFCRACRDRLIRQDHEPIHSPAEGRPL